MVLRAVGGNSSAGSLGMPEAFPEHPWELPRGLPNGDYTVDGFVEASSCLRKNR